MSARSLLVLCAAVVLSGIAVARHGWPDPPRPRSEPDERKPGERRPEGEARPGGGRIGGEPRGSSAATIGATPKEQMRARELSQLSRSQLIERLRAENREKSYVELQRMADQRLERIAAVWTNPFRFEAAFQEGTVAHETHLLLLADIEHDVRDEANHEMYEAFVSGDSARHVHADQVLHQRLAALAQWRAAFEKYRALAEPDRPAYLKELGVSSMEEYFRKLIAWRKESDPHEVWHKLLKEYHDAPDDESRRHVLERWGNPPLAADTYRTMREASVVIPHDLYRTVIGDFAADPRDPSAVDPDKARTARAIKSQVEHYKQNGAMVSTSLSASEAMAFRFRHWDKDGPPAGTKGLVLIQYEGKGDNNHGLVVTGGVNGEGHSPCTHTDGYVKCEVVRTGGGEIVSRVIVDTVGNLAPAVLGKSVAPELARWIERYRKVPMTVVTVSK